MIHLSLKDKELEAEPQIREWLDKMEEILNKDLEERFAQIKTEIDYYIGIGQPYIVTPEGEVEGIV